MSRPIRRPDWQRCGAVVAGIGGWGPEPEDAGGFAEDLRRGQRRAAGYGDQRGREVLGQCLDLGFKSVDLDGQLAASLGDRGGETGGDAGQTGEAVANAVEVADAVQRSSGWVPAGVEFV